MAQSGEHRWRLTAFAPSPLAARDELGRVGEGWGAGALLGRFHPRQEVHLPLPLRERVGVRGR